MSSATAREDPNAVWNAFVDLLVTSSYEELDDVQRPAYLAFWYESEVQNGGHLQFFENRPEELVEPTQEALHTLSARAYAQVLQEAVRRWRSQERERLESAQDFVAASLSGEFGDLDRAYYNTTPPMTEILKIYLDRNLSEFFVFEQ